MKSHAIKREISKSTRVEVQKEKKAPKSSKPPLDLKPPQGEAKHKDIGVSYMRARAVTCGDYLELRNISMTARTFVRTRRVISGRPELARS